jgi:hypothetical protein
VGDVIANMARLREEAEGRAADHPRPVGEVRHTHHMTATADADGNRFTMLDACENTTCLVTTAWWQLTGEVIRGAIDPGEYIVWLDDDGRVHWMPA